MTHIVNKMRHFFSVMKISMPNETTQGYFNLGTQRNEIVAVRKISLKQLINNTPTYNFTSRNFQDILQNASYIMH